MTWWLERVSVTTTEVDRSLDELDDNLTNKPSFKVYNQIKLDFLYLVSKLALEA